MVPHDIPLDLAAVDPGDEILHVAGNQEGRVVDDLGADADMASFHECRSLYPSSALSPSSTPKKRKNKPP
jgi:hypothetical protein